MHGLPVFSPRLLIVSLLLPLYFNHTAATQQLEKENLKTAVEQNSKDMSPEFVEAALKIAIQQLNTADQILEDLAQKLNNNVFPKADKSKGRTAITNTRSIISTLKKRSTVDISEGNLQLIVRCNDALVQQIKTMISTGLRQTPEITIDQLAVRSLLEAEALTTKLASQEKAFKKFEKTSTQAGLNIINKSFRKLEKWNKNHSLVRRILGISLLAIGVGALINHYSDFLPNNPNLEKIGGLFGSKGTSYEMHSSLAELAKKDPQYTTLVSKVLANKQDPKKITIVEKRVLERYGIAGFLATLSESETTKPLVNNAKKILGSLTSIIFLPEIYKSTNALMKVKTHIANYLRGGTPRQENDLTAKKTDITFDDVIGMDHIKKRIEPILQYLKNPEKFDQAGIQPQKGILFYGPSRTGKSYLAEALSGTIKKIFESQGQKNKFKFFHINTSDLMDWQYNHYLKQQTGHEGIEGILALAKAFAPCVLFIDELDLLRLQRERDNKALSQFLTSMSGVLTRETEKQVIIIGATNRAEHLDFALKQPGRFGNLIYFDLPLYNDRLEFFKRALERRCIDAQNFDLKKIAQETEGCTFENLNAMITTSLQNARVNHKIVTQEDLLDALNTEVRNILPAVKQLPEAELHTIAAHLSGHALATLALDTPEKLVLVTTRPISKKISERSVWEKDADQGKEQSMGTPEELAIEYGKCFTNYGADTLNIITKEQAIAQIKMLVAGFAAEKLLLGGTTYSYQSDNKRKAFDKAKKLMFAGLMERDVPKSVKNEKQQQAHALVEKCEYEVEQELLSHKDNLVKIFKDLLEHQILTADHIRTIVYGKEAVAKSSRNSQQPQLSKEQQDILAELAQALNEQEEQGSNTEKL